ncbi:transglutaminase-like domain-containing protein [Rubrivivax albus]|uniref:Transglutaminase family protein n=1 Tax=Rubrivivax albus TaxID=2499835 RepID=A0A437JMT7_9BURK|nr:transglutaminase family protein [Rubrivivax albus]RVT48110.1 transglutaminase family protein [Rubrivivax albus]
MHHIRTEHVAHQRHVPNAPDGVPPAFVQASRYCDAASEPVRDAAADITRGARTDRDRAVRVFHWTRDEIRYVVGIHRHRASETLRLRAGSCSNKANLMAAMLRSIGIPSGFHVHRVRTREYFGPLCSDRFKVFVSHESNHVSGCVLLGGRWLEADPTDDRMLSERTVHLSPQSRLVAFGGDDHARLHIEPGHLVRRSEHPSPDIDRMLEKRRRTAPQVLAVFNLYLEHCRMHAHKHQSVRSVQDSFFVWLREQRPALHAAFVASEAWQRWRLRLRDPAAQQNDRSMHDR